jgi:hypothetical protein
MPGCEKKLDFGAQKIKCDKNDLKKLKIMDEK